MTKQAVGPRIEERSAQFYGELFDSLNQGATYALESFPAMYRATLARELKGRFTTGELSLIIDNTNGLMLMPELAGQHLVLNISDAIAIEHLDERWSIDGETLVGKLQSLSLFQIAVLELWARGFWVQHTNSQHPITIEAYVSQLAVK